MGYDATAIICFGVHIEDASNLPWNKYFDGDAEDWWRAEIGYKPPFELYADDGSLIPGKSDDDKTAYWKHCYEFNKANPMPVAIVHGGWSDEPDVIIAVNGSGNTTFYGNVDEIDLSMFQEDMAEKSAFLKEFCAKHGIELNKEPAWLVTSHLSS